MATQTTQSGGKTLGYSQQRRLRSAKVNEFNIISKFKYGYRNREDETNLPPSVLVVGSKNVLTNVSERIQARAGYVLDGPANSSAIPIDSAYTFQSHLSYERNLRTYLPSAGNGKVEYRYVDSAGNVTWRTLLQSLSASSFNFTSWWDVNEKSRVILMVNGTTNIWEWGGGVTTLASSTANTITTQGTQTWAQLGFYASNTSHPTRQVTINGVDYTYTGGENTTTLTGVVPNAAAAGVAGDVIHQTPIVTANSSMTDLNLSRNDLILSFNQQLYVGSLQDQTLYLSKFQNYKDYSISSLNETGFGQQFFLDSPPVSFNALENSVTISAGLSQWYQITSVNSTYTDSTNPAAPVIYSVTNYNVNRLKTNADAAAQSQAMTSAMKNDIIFISNEPTLDTLGRVEQILGTTQTTNISDPIKLDFDSYDFTDSNIFYNKYFIYISVPKNGLVLIYNIVKSYWEAPQTIPVGKFYTVNGILYGHSYDHTESYQLFTGRADRVDPVTNPLGNAINATVVFSYQNFNSPFSLKNFNKFYVEGYINSNTTLSLGITYDIDGCATDTSYDIDGGNSQYVCMVSGNISDEDASLGKEPLGKHPLGGDLDVTGGNALPPKFRIIQTFPRKDFHEVQFSFQTTDRNVQWEILRFGPALEYSTNIPSNITV